MEDKKFKFGIGPFSKPLFLTFLATLIPKRKLSIPGGGRQTQSVSLNKKREWPQAWQKRRYIPCKTSHHSRKSNSSLFLIPPFFSSKGNSEIPTENHVHSIFSGTINLIFLVPPFHAPFLHQASFTSVYELSLNSLPRGTSLSMDAFNPWPWDQKKT